jgi:hypothetical protein
VQGNVIEAIDAWLEAARELDEEPDRPTLRATFNVLVDDDKLVPA